MREWREQVNKKVGKRKKKNEWKYRSWLKKWEIRKNKKKKELRILLYKKENGRKKYYCLLLRDNRERCFFYILLVYTFKAAMLILFKRILRHTRDGGLSLVNLDRWVGYPSTDFSLFTIRGSLLRVCACVYEREKKTCLHLEIFRKKIKKTRRGWNVGRERIGWYFEIRRY